MQETGREVYRFGAFCLDTAQRLLMRDGREVPLAPKTFDLLQFLVGNQGRLLTKSELMSALWPDTIVEEINLAFQISTLRKALGQEGAKWIETAPKHGYRFLAEVQVLEPEQHNPGRRWRIRYALTAVALLTGAVLYFVALDRSEPQQLIIPATSFPGSELYPTLSPDARQVVFSWNASGGSYDLYLHAIGSDVPTRITQDPANDLSPSWSPDGRDIAFLRYHSEREAGVYVLRLPGGPERQVATVRGGKSMDLLERCGSRLAWHPNGRWLVFSDDLVGLVLIPAEGGEKRALLPGEKSGKDVAPSFAPDGRALAFVRIHGWASSSLFRIGLTEELKPLGEPELLTDSVQWAASPVWSPDGKAIYYLSPFWLTRLRRVRHGEDEVLRDLQGEVGRVSFLSALRVGADGRTRAVFSTHAEESNIWSIVDDGSRRLARPSKMPPFLNSARVEKNAQFSPEGNRVAFMSSRSGVMEIWVSETDGRNPLQLTDFGGAQVGGSQWSPDGKMLVFPANPGGNHDVYSVPVGGGPVRRLTGHPAGDGAPSWSRDGNWIYFVSHRGGEEQVWRMQAEGGPAVQITQDGGLYALESLDRTRLFFSAPSRLGHGVSALREVPIEGGEEVTIVDPIADERAFTVVEEGLYFVETPAPDGGSRIGFYEFETGRIRWVAELDAPANWGISAYPLQRASRRTILYVQLDRSDSDIYLIENLR